MNFTTCLVSRISFPFNTISQRAPNTKCQFDLNTIMLCCENIIMVEPVWLQNDKVSWLSPLMFWESAREKAILHFQSAGTDCWVSCFLAGPHITVVLPLALLSHMCCKRHMKGWKSTAQLPLVLSGSFMEESMSSKNIPWVLFYFFHCQMGVTMLFVLSLSLLFPFERLITT